jgi:hypothetical protein
MMDGWDTGLGVNAIRGNDARVVAVGDSCFEGGKTGFQRFSGHFLDFVKII